MHIGISMCMISEMGIIIGNDTNQGERERGTATKIVSSCVGNRLSLSRLLSSLTNIVQCKFPRGGYIFDSFIAPISKSYSTAILS